MPVGIWWIIIGIEKVQRFSVRDQLEISGRTTSAAEAALLDIFICQEVTDQVPRSDDGRLGWFHSGSEDNIEWDRRLNRHYPVNILLEMVSDWQSGIPPL